MKKIFFFILLFLNFDKFLSKIKVHNKEVITLNFHRINYTKDSLWPSMSPKNFEKLIKILKKNTNIISIEKIYSPEVYSDNLPIVIISFDDGYKDFFEFALPILKRNNVPAHMNICPGLIENKQIPWTQLINYFLSNKNKNLSELLNKYKIEFDENIDELKFNKICNKIISLNYPDYINFIDELYKLKHHYGNLLMNWREINECFNNKILIGCHSMNHLNLNKEISKDRKYLETIKSKSIIEKNINNNIDIFCFPNGIYDKNILYELKENYKYLLLCEDKNTIISKKQNNYILPRINISKNDHREEYFRALGFHQLIKKIIYKKDYIFQQ